MTQDEFYNQLINQMNIPFDIELVKSVEENCGTIWFELTNGETYYLTIQQCLE